MKTQKIIGAGLTLAMLGTLGVGSAEAMLGVEKGERDFSKAKMHIKNRAERVDLSEEQKQVLKELRESKDLDALKEKLEEYGVNIQKRARELGAELTQEQRDEIKKLRESGDKDALHDILKEFGIEHFKKKGFHLGVDLTQEQRDELKELRELKDFDAVLEKLSDFGVSEEKINQIEDKREIFEEQKEIFEGIFSDEDKEKLQEARDLKKEGDKEAAHELKKEVYEANKEEIKEAREEAGLKGFFKRTKSFFKGWFK